MSRRRKSWFLVLLLTTLATLPLLAAETSKPANSPFGGKFDTLAPQQQQLVRAWFAEYQEITGNKVDPEAAYDTLSPSVRTTFEAVTHALMKSKLTSPDGKSLGNALSLVKMVEAVHGEIPKVRGDEQFRIYVLLADNAVDKLYEAVEFKRTGDNTVYHIGYPINFRQQGGNPSIQFSVTRTGLRADIDVDYRSSGGPMALVNGHLTAANSDVRAGGNYLRHTRRWSGFSDWWKSLFGSFNRVPQADLDALSSEYLKPKVPGSQPVEAAALDFFQSWLVEDEPQRSLTYVSVKANACVAQLGSGVSARSSLVRLRAYEAMKQTNQRLGKVHSLEDVLHGVVIAGKDTKPVDQPDGKLFAVAQLPDDVAWSLDCRTTQGLPLAEPLPQGTHTYGHFYGISTTLRGKDEEGPGRLLYFIWTHEEGYWRIASWYRQNPFDLATAPSAKPQPPPPVTKAAVGAAAPELANRVQSLLDTWLIQRNYAAAATFFSTESLPCGIQELGIAKSGGIAGHTTVLNTWLKEVADAIPQGKQLDASIESVEYDPNQKEAVPHSDEQAYVLVRISDDLAGMSNCLFRSSGARVSRNATVGDATFKLNAYQVIFEPKHEEGDRGAVVLTWELRNNRWMVVDFHVDHY